MNYKTFISVEFKYFLHIVHDIEKCIRVYNMLFSNRDTKIESILDNDISLIMVDISKCILKIENDINSINLEKINTKFLEDVSKDIDNLFCYYEYVAEKALNYKDFYIKDILKDERRELWK